MYMYMHTPVGGLLQWSVDEGGRYRNGGHGGLPGSQRRGGVFPPLGGGGRLDAPVPLRLGQQEEGGRRAPVRTLIQVPGSGEGRGVEREWRGCGGVSDFKITQTKSWLDSTTYMYTCNAHHGINMYNIPNMYMYM